MIRRGACRLQALEIGADLHLGMQRTMQETAAIADPARIEADVPEPIPMGRYMVSRMRQEPSGALHAQPGSLI